VHPIYLLKFFDRNHYLFYAKNKNKKNNSKGLHFDKCCQRHKPVQCLEDYDHHLSILDTNVGGTVTFKSYNSKRT